MKKPPGYILGLRSFITNSLKTIMRLIQKPIRAGCPRQRASASRLNIDDEPRIRSAHSCLRFGRPSERDRCRPTYHPHSRSWRLVKHQRPISLKLSHPIKPRPLGKLPRRIRPSSHGKKDNSDRPSQRDRSGPSPHCGKIVTLGQPLRRILRKLSQSIH